MNGTRGNSGCEVFKTQSKHKIFTVTNFLLLLILSPCFANAARRRFFGHQIHLEKTLPKTWDDNCKGKRDEVAYRKVQDICDDCGKGVYKSDKLFEECRKDCFGTDYFTGCLNVLQFDDDQTLLNYVSQIRGIEDTS
ncbi:hypothetical protein QAD02_005702 [Eretmocerus hayati]|uniref:Uncharacterized protein n=1 Tax=Eretmocerus hayati TaxID=131215 RepID=A0ACC2NT52_9HYME|nr:hypothetical protein QAD02_005702 [Eretmocerus hayati]